MKKLVIASAIAIIILCLSKEGMVLIPKEAIRFRVIANSDSELDQNLKKEVVKDLKDNINQISLTPKDINISREKIKESIPLLSHTIDTTLKRLNSNQSYKINYGKNYFPEKEYKGVVYEEGEYESLVVTMGDGQGENFWCVLFPPLCLLEGEESDKDEIEYTSFIKELIAKYL